jgi:hypothetical protein
MPYNGQPGRAKDGTPVVWVASVGAALPATEAKKYGVTPRTAAAGAGGPAGYDAAQDTGDYQKKVAQARAAEDIKTLTAGRGAEHEAYQNEQDADYSASIVKQAPSGFLGDARLMLGKSPLGKVAGGWFGVPNREDTVALEQLNEQGNRGALANTTMLKGPMSDKDVAFLKSLSYSINSTPEHNAKVAEAAKWASKRQAAYGASMRTWTQKLGSPSSLNPQGQDFEQWWGQWSGENLPRPGTQPITPRAMANGQLKQQSAQARANSDPLGIRR